jgi:uncharacterized membrane protein (DUF106 family)
MAIKDILIANPKTSIVVIAFLITLITTIITKKFTNQNRMRELKEIQKSCQIKLKDAKGNPEEMAKIQKQMMECSMELMKHSFKPTLYTFIPLLIFFIWIRGIFSSVLSSWIWWYLGAGIISSIILRKALKVV